jgi:hypothetical protein
MATCELWLGRMRLFRLGILRPRFPCATTACEASVFCGNPSYSIMNGVKPAVRGDLCLSSGSDETVSFGISAI